MKKKTNRPKPNPLWLMPYHDRQRGYEADKDAMLRTSGTLSAAEYQKRLDELIFKWNI